METDVKNAKKSSMTEYKLGGKAQAIKSLTFFAGDNLYVTRA
ncbi:hypothetical protein [Magnetococcus sp. PR-3]